MSEASIATWEALARAASAPVEAEEVRERDLLCFAIDGEVYAVGVEAVREIVRLRPVTPIPRSAAAVRGVISLRGAMLQLVDLRLLLGLEAVEETSRSRILVVSREDGRLAGMLVDSVSEVLRVPVASIGPTASGDPADLVCGLCERDGRFVSLLDLDKAMDLDAKR